MDVAGYEDYEDGTSAFVYDDGTKGPLVILTDEDKKQIDTIAALRNQEASVGQPVERVGTTVLDNASRPDTAGPDFNISDPAVEAAPGHDPRLTPKPPGVYNLSPQEAANVGATQTGVDAWGDPIYQTAEDVAASNRPTTATAPGARTTLPTGAEITEQPLGDDATGVRQDLLDAAAFREEAAANKTIAMEKAATEKGRLIGDRLAKLEAQQQADVIEEKRKQDAIAQANKRYQQVAEAPIDPKQAFGGEPAWFKIMTLIGLAAGAAHSGKSHTLDAVNQTIDQSVTLQRDQKSNEIQRLTRVLGSEEGALSALRARMQQAVERRLELGILQADNEAEAAWLRTSASAIRAQRLEEEAKAKAATATSIKTQTATPKAGPGNPAANWNAQTAEENAILKANGTDDKRMAKYTDERVKLGADAVINLADDAEATIGRLTDGQDVPGAGPLDELLQPLMRGADAAAVQQTAGMLKSAFIKAQSGASTTDSERAQLQKLIEGRGTLEDFKRGIALLRSKANNDIETLSSGYSAESRAYGQIKGIRRQRAIAAQRAELQAKSEQEKETARKHLEMKDKEKKQKDKADSDRYEKQKRYLEERGQYENSVPADDGPDPFDSNVVPQWNTPKKGK
jgi:hypothetical protein